MIPLKRDRPLLPPLDHLQVVEGEKTATRPAIAKCLPLTSGLPTVTLKSGGVAAKPLRVGVVLSGGPAPGGHNVIAGLFDALEGKLFGFLDGPSGILEGKRVELTAEMIDAYRNTGGFDLIGTGRTKIEGEAALKQAMEATSDLDGLVIVGGDDSNTNAALMAEYFLAQGSKTRVIGVPKTIDGDLRSDAIEISFGFDTACRTYSELIGNLAQDARSIKKYVHFVRLMGRSASHITLECALQTQPNVALIGEERRSLKAIAQELAYVIKTRADAGKNYGVILIPEGLIEFDPEMKALIRALSKNAKLSPQEQATFDFLPKAMQEQLRLDRDPHGNVQVSHIATEDLLIGLVRGELGEKAFRPIRHFFGYEGRSGYPSNFDAAYCLALGAAAAHLIAGGLTGYMAIVRGLSGPRKKWELGGIPFTLLMDLEERKGREKPVIRKTLIDLKGAPYQTYVQQREQWALDDAYQSPGPIQFEGEPEVCDQPPMTLLLEHGVIDAPATTR